MDIEKLIERLRRYSEPVIAYKLDSDFAASIEEAAIILSSLQAENEKLRGYINDLETQHRTEMCENGYDCVELGKLRAELDDLKAQWDMYGGDEGITAMIEERDRMKAELEQVKRERDAAVKDMELIARRINDCNIKLEDGTTVSSLELGRCHICRREETCDCDGVGCIFEWRGHKED